MNSRLWKNFLAGVLLMTFSLVWLAMQRGSPSVAYAQDTANAEYVGEQACNTCHRDMRRPYRESTHARTLQVAKANPDAIVADFSQGDAIRTVQFPGESSARPVTAGDIALVIGSGKSIQRYVYAAGGTQYTVLPFEWDANTQAWQPYQLAVTWPDPAYDWTQNCAGCHTTAFDSESGQWLDAGVQCESCHGPGSIHVSLAEESRSRPSDEELTAIRATINAGEDPQICGQCHSSGTSADGTLPYPVDYQAGDDLAASFVLTGTDDAAHWWASGHANQPNMQYNEWAASGHATALTDLLDSADADATCLQCHTSPSRLESAADNPATLETAQFGVGCVTCHDPHSDGERDALLVDEPLNLCVNCHSNGNYETIHHPTVEMIEGQTLMLNVAGVPTKHTTAENGPDCLTCHMQELPVAEEGRVTHTFQPVMPGLAAEGEPDACTSCHTDLTRSAAQTFIDKAQTDTNERLTVVMERLAATQSEQWVTASAQFVAGDGSLGVHNVPYSEALLNAAEVELGIASGEVPSIFAVRPIENPQDCAECHLNEHRDWQSSPHANASLSEAFQQAYTENGRPSYCFRCHASGYDPNTEQYVFEGVVCSNCHAVPEGTEHPPAPIGVSNDSALCGTCHSGAHAPVYDEWLVSKHSAAGIDCVDCHTPHNNELVRDDINTTCADCHANSMNDEVHMAADMVCTDCHMTPRVKDENGFSVLTGHTMDIDPGVCADCHGNIHELTVSERQISPQDQAEVASLREEVTRLQSEADNNLNSGVVGGAIGGLLLVAMLYIVVRFRRFL